MIRDFKLEAAAAYLGGDVLPFDPLVIPPYYEDDIGSWSLRREKIHLRPRGYFTGLQNPPESNWVLRDRGMLWMSVSPMELESLAPQVVFASGRVIVLGLGMGVVLYNLLLKPEVKDIVVIERDPEVIALIKKQAKQMGWPRMDLVRFVESDAYAWTTRKRADFVLVDIWLTLGESSLRQDLQRLAVGIPARRYAAWGMELDYISWLSENKIHINVGMRRTTWKRYAEEIGVPLVGHNVPWMGTLSLRAGVQAALLETD